jgi:hypothetical protein
MKLGKVLSEAAMIRLGPGVLGYVVSPTRTRSGKTTSLLDFMSTFSAGRDGAFECEWN